ncbi:hypothetical protein LTR78_002112 [Recurvomyces mirabilis]|uniref:Uncharacterized protein n=1 Tax=Recurvomyces mirabilis TaxID=574656 RepID=A0AAE1C4Q5_9PEZI|nr:hypothetical protein LTR78_002112 [Recurvomyces mirabilis]KAK5160570.1 hypothetical protein LTS14_001582 [Recurvomyces mirabilis]
MSQLLEFLRTHDTAFNFRLQRHSNPDGYEANSAAWLSALTAAAKEGLIPIQTGAQHDRFSLHTGEELLRALQTQEYGRPLALGSAIEDAVRKKELVPLQEFLDAKQSVYTKSWLPTPWQVMSWSLRQLGVTGREGAEDKLVTGNFVMMANVEAAAKAVINEATTNATSNTSRIFSRDLFSSSFAPTIGARILSQRDVSVLLTHLARDHAAVAYDTATGTVKFRAASETSVPTIGQEDVTIASLRTLISSLEPQVQQLIQHISELDAKVRNAVSSKQMSPAKTALRQKKLAESKLQQRSATLAQLEEVYAKIEQAADQVEMVRVMEASSQALRSLNQKTGGVENVQDVMEGLQEEMMNVDEIQQAINEPAAGTIDEGEVDDELEALERAEREKAEAVECAEREKREAEEAELTQKRLAEVVDFPDAAGVSPGQTNETASAQTEQPAVQAE